MDEKYLKNKKKIDRVFEENAKLFTRPENTNTKTAKEKTKALEKKNLRAIKHLAPDLIDRILKASD